MNDLPKQRPKTRHSNSFMEKDAYTEDNITIKTIYVGNLSSKITKKEVKQYFLKFGSVASVAIKRIGSKRVPWIYAFVTFEESESAAKALDLEEHEIRSRRVKVIAANSWNQPKEKDAKCKRNEVSRDEASEMDFSLLHLNDDCLYHVASYLELRDFFNLSKTCQRLECRLEPIFASYKKLDMDSLHGLTLAAIREILYKIGPHVQHIIFSEFSELNRRRLEKLLKKYFVAVNIVSVDCSGAITTIQEYNENLRTKCHITDDIIAALSNYSNLQSLDLYGSTHFTGKHLDKLSNLQNLNFNRCSNLRPQFFNNLCMKTKLVSLNIAGCTLLNNISIETLANTQTKLETLSISNDYGTSNLSPLTTLKNLKRLRIDSYYRSCDEFFEELAKQSGAELEVLEISIYCFNQKVERAIYSLKKLKVFTMYNCEYITNMFLNKLALTSLECVAIFPLKATVEEGLLNLISKSETIKVIAIKGKNQLVDERRLVLSAHEIIRKKERKYPLSLFTTGPYIIDGIYHEEPKLERPQIKFRKIIKKLGYLGQLPWYNDFHIFD